MHDFFDGQSVADALQYGFGGLVNVVFAVPAQFVLDVIYPLDGVVYGSVEC